MTRPALDLASLPGDEERRLLRDALRGYLATHWPAATAVARAGDAAAVAAVWQGLAVDQGLGQLGADAAEGGWRETLLALEELGRAACPAPLLGHALAWALQRAHPEAGAALAAVLGAPSARVVWAFGALDPDAQAGLVRHAEGTVSGCLRCVDGAPYASDLLAVGPDGASLLHAATTPPLVQTEATRALGAAGWGQLTLHRAPVVAIAVPRATLEDLVRLARLGLLARAHGAARRAFELVVAYAGERRQFGQPIGRFQAIQHKLADGLMALEGVRLALEQAALACDTGRPGWRYAAAAAVAAGGPALRAVALQVQHAFGAIGYAEEHEAPRHFRRAHLDTLLHGGAAAARAELAAHWLDPLPQPAVGAAGGAPAEAPARLPEDDLGPAGNALRATVRAWLQTHWSGERKAAFDARPFHEREFDAAFARDLGRTGWLGLGWPLEHGGQARSAREQLAFLEVMEQAEAPRAGAAVQAHALILHGTPAQQARYLPEILRGEAMHGMGYSEPQAGSDLAALVTRAVRAHDADGEHWVVTGQKIWTTTWWGRYMFLAARTDPAAQPPHAGISMFIVPMDAPGITVHPARTMYDGSFANIFYDGVRLPPDALLGPLHGGWKVLTDALAAERGLVGGGIVLKVAHGFELLCRDLRADGAAAADPLVRERIGTLAAEIEIGRRLMLHCAELAESGATPPELAAISKVYSGELMERFGQAALDLLGSLAALSQHAAGALRGGRYEQMLRHALMWVISIGTNEIQRSLIAQRGLGLPK